MVKIGSHWRNTTFLAAGHKTVLFEKMDLGQLDNVNRHIYLKGIVMRTQIGGAKAWQVNFQFQFAKSVQMLYLRF